MFYYQNPFPIFLSSMRAICLADSIALDLITWTVFGEEQQSFLIPS
jgi:hypothetical protein